MSLAYAIPGHRPELRILHCIPSLGGGGAERQLAYLGSGMAERGISTHVVYLYDGPNSAALRDSPVVLHRIECRGNHDPRILTRLWRVAREQQPDVIQTWLPQMDVAGAMVAHALGRPFVVAERSSEANYAPGWKTRLRRMLGLRAAAIVANSEGGKAYWIKQGFRGRIDVIRNALPLEAMGAAGPPPALAGIHASTAVILFAGRFSPEKNLPTTVTALASVLRRHPDAVALLFGQGPLESEIAAMCSAAGDCAPRLRLGGYSSDLWSWLRRADVFVSASLYEGHPNAVIEAAALGCPLVVSDIPAHREFLDDDSARLVPASAPDAIAEAICDVLSRREVARARAARAQARARRFALGTVVEQYIGLYTAVIAASQARPRTT